MACRLSSASAWRDRHTAIRRFMQLPIQRAPQSLRVTTERPHRHAHHSSDRLLRHFLAQSKLRRLQRAHIYGLRCAVSSLIAMYVGGHIHLHPDEVYHSAGRIPHGCYVKAVPKWSAVEPADQSQ